MSIAPYEFGVLHGSGETMPALAELGNILVAGSSFRTYSAAVLSRNSLLWREVSKFVAAAEDAAKVDDPMSKRWVAIGMDARKGKHPSGTTYQRPLGEGRAVVASRNTAMLEDLRF